MWKGTGMHNLAPRNTKFSADMFKKVLKGRFFQHSKYNFNLNENKSKNFATWIKRVARLRVGRDERVAQKVFSHALRHHQKAGGHRRGAKGLRYETNDDRDDDGCDLE